VMLERACFGRFAVDGAEIVDDAIPFVSVFELEYRILGAIWWCIVSDLDKY
jgi:hypothetical protein